MNEERHRYFHVWFSTKGRNAVLEGDIENAIRDSIMRIASEDNIGLLQFELNYDHVHLLIGIDGAERLPWAMKQLKGRSAYELFRQIPELKLDMHSDSLRQKGYGWREVLPHEVEVVGRYILSQKDRPHRH
jgi:putative transposase